MADNTVINLGSGGDTIATDDVAGVKYPRTKLSIGEADAVPTDVSEANPMPTKDSRLAIVLNALLQAVADPPTIDKSLNRTRQTAIIESGTITTVSTVSSVTSVITVNTVTTVTGLTNIDGYQGKLLTIGQDISAWANVVRSRIS